MSAPFEVMRELLAASALELFESYGLSASLCECPEESEEQFVGVLGFIGGQVAGSVALTGDARAFSTCHPNAAGTLWAWVGELTNQVVGRFKNNLLMRGVDVTMSIPCVLRGFRLVPVPRNEIATVHLTLGDAHLSLWLEVEGDPVFVEADPDIIPPSGEALLF